MTPPAWRFLLSPAADGPANMAIDEAILAAVASGESLPTVRVYSWQPPCLSLGYFQPLTEADLGECVRRGIAVVRRATGGSAILHADELTYSVTVGENDPLVRGDVLSSYQTIARVLLDALARLGVAATLAPAGRRSDGPPDDGTPGKRPAPCFLRPAGHEIMAQGRKLVGSAQMRRAGVILQHGAMPLDGDTGEICSLLAMSPAVREASAGHVRRRAITLAEAAGRPVPFSEAADALRQAFAGTWAVRFEPGGLSAAEWSAAAALRQERYRDLARGQ